MNNHLSIINNTITFFIFWWYPKFLLNFFC
jgi:hypothetical protein